MIMFVATINFAFFFFLKKTYFLCAILFWINYDSLSPNLDGVIKYVNINKGEIDVELMHNWLEGKQIVEHVALFIVSKTEINNDCKRWVTSYEGGRQRHSVAMTTIAFFKSARDACARFTHKHANARAYGRERVRDRDMTERGAGCRKQKVGEIDGRE